MPARPANNVNKRIYDIGANTPVDDGLETMVALIPIKSARLLRIALLPVLHLAVLQRTGRGSKCEVGLLPERWPTSEHM